MKNLFSYELFIICITRIDCRLLMLTWLISSCLTWFCFFFFFLVWQEKLKTTTSSLQLSEAENELQSECNRNPLSKALLLMHMAGQAVTSKSHVGTERQTQLLQACCFTRIYFSLVQLHCTVTPFWFSICITQSRFCVTHVCFVYFVTHLCCYVTHSSFYIANYPAHIIASMSHIVLHILTFI